MARKRYPPTDPREWLNRARSNLALARSETVGALPEDLCFEAQQAAEKAVKAVFVHRGARFPYITTWMNCSNGSREAASRYPNPSSKRTNFHRSPW
jgi:hypothetical protein